MGSIPVKGRPPGEQHGNPPQYSCLENPKDTYLVDYTPKGSKVSDTTEQLSTHTHMHGRL